MSLEASPVARIDVCEDWDDAGASSATAFRLAGSRMWRRLRYIVLAYNGRAPSYLRQFEGGCAIIACFWQNPSTCQVAPTNRLRLPRLVPAKFKQQAWTKAVQRKDSRLTRVNRNFIRDILERTGECSLKSDRDRAGCIVLESQAGNHQRHRCPL